MQQRKLILPDDQALVEVFGPADSPSKRAYRLRLRRAEKRGVLPRRHYTSTQRFGYWADELDAKLAALPTTYVAAAG